MISSKGLRIEEGKISTILEWPLPSGLRQLCQFLGFCNFYRRFIPKFLGLARPLTELTKEGHFSEEKIQQIGPRLAFLALKKCFSTAPLLHHFNFHLPWIVHIDSSGYAIAAVLSQPDQSGKINPVSFYSRKLSERERGWAIFTLELLVIVESFEQWREWLMGTQEPVWVYSDHSNVCHFSTAKHLTPKQAHWASFLDRFNFTLHHLLGKTNPVDTTS
jgi:hypothetical protein